ncbi:hypothetical protein NDU88_002827 [Pleurodeles waltl]|uniref:Uncharacterized protein n=1 Tax=Pleurodeles waltl TaxID=8319 RepID=A0AAV7MNT1_PLEWA|nr:hypothetical protein NDU88_002827 [Pleurodeles waltl]
MSLRRAPARAAALSPLASLELAIYRDRRQQAERGRHAAPGSARRRGAAPLAHSVPLRSCSKRASLLSCIQRIPGPSALGYTLCVGGLRPARRRSGGQQEGSAAQVPPALLISYHGLSVHPEPGCEGILGGGRGLEAVRAPEGTGGGRLV